MAPQSHRLAVVLERRTMLYALETLELLRTVDTVANPEVRGGLGSGLSRGIDRVLAGGTRSYRLIRCARGELLLKIHSAPHAHTFPRVSAR